MNYLKIILPLALLTGCFGCSCDSSNSSIQNGGSEPILIPISNPHPINPLTSTDTGTTLQLVTGGFASVDSGNQSYRSNKYQAHGHVRFMAGYKHAGNAYQGISSDLSIKK